MVAPAINAAFFGVCRAGYALDDCSVTADLKLALAFQGPHPGIFVLGQKQPLILTPAPQGAVDGQDEKFRHVPGIVP